MYPDPLDPFPKTDTYRMAEGASHFSVAESEPQASLTEENVLARLFGGATLAEFNRVPAGQLEAVYAQGCGRVDAEDFPGALDSMLHVVVHNPYEFRYQFGYALCLHQLGQVADAAKHYGLAFMLDPSDAGTAFRLGECHAALGDREAAAEALETAMALCGPPALQSDIRMAAEVALSSLHA